MMPTMNGLRGQSESLRLSLKHGKKKLKLGKNNMTRRRFTQDGNNHNFSRTQVNKMKLSTALYLSVALINACNGNAKRSLEADVHSCACEALEFAFEINCEDTATVSSVTRSQSPRVLCFYPLSLFLLVPSLSYLITLTCSILLHVNPDAGVHGLPQVKQLC